jgi:pyrroloquinoline-quinone synthase
LSEAFVARLREAGRARYHDRHPFHVRMHEGRLSRAALAGWVENRFYYQTRIPIKDAIVLSKSEDAAFRRRWLRRIVDHDGRADGEGGLADWLLLAEGVGLDRARVLGLGRVLPGVRRACDAYVALVRERPLVEAVASSLTELFAPELMATRIRAWETHYPWVDRGVLHYFRTRIPRATRDGEHALGFVVEHARSAELQDRCVAALRDKCTILWSMLDAIAAEHDEAA